MKRRTFLQRSGVALAAIGLSQAGLSLLCDRYYQALAQSSPRKLALLVGIDQYSVGAPLTGCLTDVELQRELLIYRFGFNPSDILILTDRQATRQNIETAFLEHLTKQAKPGDVVVFHFSGYGSRLEGAGEQGSGGAEEQGSGGESAVKPPKTQNLLLPVDGILLGKNSAGVNALPEETLWMLLRSLQTELLTAVLDTSYTQSSILLQGNLRVRSRPETPSGVLTQEELAFQEQLKQIPKLAKPINSTLTTSLPGVVLTAARPEQLATEGQIDGFSAGCFTYALTQHLWQATPAMTLQLSLNRITGTVEQLVGNKQQPQICGETHPNQTLLTYHLLPQPIAGADGVVISTEEGGKAGQLWLGGIPAKVLQSYGANSLFTLVGSQSDTEGVQPLQVIIRSREGLKAKARINSTNPTDTSKLETGQLVQEAVRVLPRNVGLTVALDANLERIERVDATSAIAVIPNVSSVVAGEQAADCLLGRVFSPELAVSRQDLETASKTQDSKGSQTTVIKSSYGLFSPGLEAIPNTGGEVGEAVKTAVNRLNPKLQTLLAAKLLRLTANEGSSRLGVRATLEMVSPNQQVLMQRTTVRAPWPAPTASSVSPSSTKEGILGLPIDSYILYHLHNYSDAPVYFMLLGIDNSGSPIAFLPAKFAANPTDQVSDPFANQVIAPGETKTIPTSSTPFKWVIQGPPGLVETQLIFSRAPLTQTLTALENAKLPGSQRLITLTNPLEVAKAVLQDIHQASAADTATTSPDTLSLDVNAWATLSFIYQVI